MTRDAQPEPSGQDCDPVARSRLERLAARYVWWTPAARTVDENLLRLIAAVMEMGTWEDAAEMTRLVGADAMSAVLDDPPPGVISAKSLAFWHVRLGRASDPPTPSVRFVPQEPS